MPAAPPSLDPRQPVLVGVGTCVQREDDTAAAREPLDLMIEAVQRAADDAGARDALREVGHIVVPKGRWRYRNPAGAIAGAIEAASATTVLASVGVLQQTLIGDACARIAAGTVDLALVVGGDAGYRILRSRQAGRRAPERQQDDDPDVLLEADEELLHPAELKAGITLPAPLYALLESAWRARRGWSVAAHRDRIAELMQRFSEIAADNPEAWRRKRLVAAEIREASERNPMQAFPYTRLHCSTWSVDQAGALLLCSVGKARSLGIAPDRWIHPLASTESNHMTPVSARADLTACAGARLAGQAALSAAGLAVDAIDLVDLYSCFPIAVESFAEALGLPLTRDLTVTGGMPFAGGPFNNYVLQATCRMARLLRQGHGRTGLVSSVSGVLTKQGFGVWSTEPGTGRFAFADVSAEAARESAARRVLESHDGPATVVACTTERGDRPRALVLADTPAGDRVLASSHDGALIERIESVEFCAAAIVVRGDTFSIG